MTIEPIECNVNRALMSLQQQKNPCIIGTQRISPFNSIQRRYYTVFLRNAHSSPLQYFQCIQQSKVDQNNSILHHRKKSIISLNSTQEVDSNSANSYIEYSPFNNKRRGMLLHSIEQIGCNGY
ncbi:hypothetical protein STEG23_004034 [Scotinomys teguina]